MKCMLLILRARTNVCRLTRPLDWWTVFFIFGSKESEENWKAYSSSSAAERMPLLGKKPDPKEQVSLKNGLFVWLATPWLTVGWIYAHINLLSRWKD